MGRATYSGRYRLSPAIFTRKSLRGSSGQLLDGDASGDASATGGLGIAKNLAGGATGIATASADATVGGLPSFSPGPSISGSATVGVAKSYTPGTVNGFPTPTVTRQWLRNGVAISGATNATYTPVTADIGTNTLSVRETATNTYGTVSSTSSPVSVAAASGSNPNDRYVREGAGGNGSSWSNAWSSIGQAINSGQLVPGATVWIAGGSYASFWVQASLNGTSGNPITFKKATVENHGSNSGWLDSYDTQVQIAGDIEINGNFITIDGQVKGADLESGYGIRIRNGFNGIQADDGTGTDNLTIRYCDISTLPLTGTSREDAIQGKGNNLLIEHCFLHNNDNHTNHGDGLQWFFGDNIVIRFNVFKNNGQHMIFGFGDTSFGSTTGNMQIYYNLLYNRGYSSSNPDDYHYYGLAFNPGCPRDGTTVTYYNNTHDYAHGWDGLRGSFSGSDGFNAIFNFSGARTNGVVIAKNNVFRDVACIGLTNAQAQPNRTHNIYDTSTYTVGVQSTAGGCQNPPSSQTGEIKVTDIGFVNGGDITNRPMVALDFRLGAGSLARNSGTSVGLSTDILGNAVPGTTPHMGCFQT